MIIAANSRAFIGDACADAQTLPRGSNDTFSLSPCLQDLSALSRFRMHNRRFGTHGVRTDVEGNV